MSILHIYIYIYIIHLFQAYLLNPFSLLIYMDMKDLA